VPERAFKQQLEEIFTAIAAVSDHSTFRAAYEHRPETIGAVPALHTAFQIFAFFDARTASQISSAVKSESAIIDGAKGLHAALKGAGGLSGLLSAGFSVSVGDFLGGVSGLLGLLGGGEGDAIAALADALQAMLTEMMRCISAQLHRLHEDMLEGFRSHAIALNIVDLYVIRGSVLLEQQLQLADRKSEAHFTTLMHVLATHTTSLQSVLHSLKTNERYHMVHQIDDSGWSELLSKVRVTCRSGQMSAAKLEEGVAEIATKLEMVREHAVARANSIDRSDLEQLEKAFAAVSYRLGSSAASSTGSSKFQTQPQPALNLATEQHIRELLYLASIAFIPAPGKKQLLALAEAEACHRIRFRRC
jgi:hypothetical protein